MMRKILIAVVFLFAFTHINAQNINTEKSGVTFEIRNMKMRTVEGSFSGMKGELIFNTNSLTNAIFSVCIDAATVFTDDEKRDAHLKNEDFFHIEKYPNICFVSNSITKQGDNFIAYGTLTMHGVSKQIDLPFEFNDNTFIGKITLNRLDYKVGEDMGTFMVADKVKITITCAVE